MWNLVGKQEVSGGFQRRLSSAYGIEPKRDEISCRAKGGNMMLILTGNSMFHSS